MLLLIGFLLPTPAFSLEKSVANPNLGIIFISPSILIFECLKEIIYFDWGVFLNLIIIPSIAYFIIGAIMGLVIVKIKEKK